MEICAEGLWKSYSGRIVLRDLSFTAGPGVTCILGPSGSGKTTLLRLLLGLEAPDRGAVRYAGDCRWGAVFQEDRLLEHLDAGGNLRFALGGAYDEASAGELLEALGLGGEGGRAVGEFSGGMKRRLALARALLAPGDALALDEPFAGLDEASGNRAADCIRRWGAGKPVLLVTHLPGGPEALGGASVLRLSPPE